jgi:hypothetical protein
MLLCIFSTFFNERFQLYEYMFSKKGKMCVK